MIKHSSLLTTQEVAKWLNQSPRKVWALKASGDLPHIKIGSSVRFKVDDVEEFIRRNTHGEST
jgi:excisionase family DNA binding protein